MHLVMAVVLGCVAGSWAFCPVFPASRSQAVSNCQGCRAARGLQLRMADDMWERIGRVAKDKVSGAKGWVDKGANLDADINVRGATSGAVIGALVAGPFGAIVGGWLGKGSGLSRAAEDKELERIGMTRESAKLMQQLVMDFQESNDALTDITSTCTDLERRVAKLKKDVTSAFEAAKEKLIAGDEDGARAFLADKVKAEEQLKRAEELFADMDVRRQQLKLSVGMLEERLLDFQTMATRARSAGVMLKTSDPLSGGALDGTIRDPLLDKFDKWEKEGNIQISQDSNVLQPSGGGGGDLCPAGGPHAFKALPVENEKKTRGGGLSLGAFGFGGGGFSGEVRGQDDRGQRVILYCERCGQAKTLL